LPGYLIASLRIFFVELCDERFAALRIRLFERGLRVVRDSISHQRNRRKHGDQKDEK